MEGKPGRHAVEKEMQPLHVHHNGYPIPDEAEIPLLQRLFRSRIGLTLPLLFGCVFGIPTIVYLIWPMSLFVVCGAAISHGFFRRYVDVTIGCWIYMYAYMIEKLFGINVRVFGHKEKFSERSLIILNHRCHFDWLYFWMVVGKRGDCSSWLVMLKRIGKLLPFFGWTMQTRNHFFLSRKWEQDKNELNWKLNYLKAMDSKYQILMFPEGTDLNPKSKARSDTFADTNNLPKYNYVLHPKCTGFVYTLKTLKEYKIDAVYDITVGYPDVLAKTEVDMFVNRKIPREIHYHIKRFEASSIPESEDGMEKWLRERWDEKEERLHMFYTHHEFRDLSTDKETAITSNGYNMTNGTSETMATPEVFGNMTFFRFFLSQLFYTGHGSFFLFLCYLNWYCIIWGVLSACWLQYLSMYTPGLDFWIMRQNRQPEFVRRRNMPQQTE